MPDQKIDDKIYSIDRNSTIPLYHQIKQNLRELIESGTIKPETILPSEKKLSEIYSVNRLTVRGAITDLVHEGLLNRRHGIGTFVLNKKLTESLVRVIGFSERLQKEGHKTTSIVISQEIINAPISIARILNIDINSQIHKIIRIRLVDGESFRLETNYLSREKFPDLEKVNLENESLYRILAEKYQCQIVLNDEILEPILLTEYEAKLLGAKEKSIGMLRQGISYDSKGFVVEYVKAIVRGDKARFRFKVSEENYVIDNPISYIAPNNYKISS